MTERNYPAIAAKVGSLCPHCSEDIVPGDAITQRKAGEPWCHIGCAYAEDEREADVFELDRLRADWRDKAAAVTRQR